jgi:bifunctional DNase/RNase
MEQQNDEWEVVQVSMTDRWKQAKTIEEYIQKYGQLPDAQRMTKIMSIEEVIEEFGYTLNEEQIQKLKDGTTE